MLYDFAIAVHPVTVTQFRQSNVEDYFDDETIESNDSPAELVSWFEIAEYCNWLCDQEDIPEDQWCFEPNVDGNYSWGMKLKTNYDQLKGYRLPTTQEWMYAGRCHAKTRFIFGEPNDLVDQNCWYSENTRGTTRNVKTLPPNGFGMTDIHGSVWEFTMDMRELESNGTVGASSRSFLLGGAMNSGASYASFQGVTDGTSPDYRSHTYGFRLAKSLPVDSEKDR